MQNLSRDDIAFIVVLCNRIAGSFYAGRMQSVRKHESLWKQLFPSRSVC